MIQFPYMCALNNDELAPDTHALMSQLQARRVMIRKVGEVTINISLPKGHEVLITHQKTAPEMRHHVYLPWIRRRWVICTVKPSFNSSLTSSVVNCQPLVTTPSKCFCVETWLYIPIRTECNVQRKWDIEHHVSFFMCTQRPLCLHRTTGNQSISIATDDSPIGNCPHFSTPVRKEMD